MSSMADGSGSIFAGSLGRVPTEIVGGLSKRELFAVFEMHALIMRMPGGDLSVETLTNAAGWARLGADILLKELAK